MVAVPHIDSPAEEARRRESRFALGLAAMPWLVAVVTAGGVAVGARPSALLILLGWGTGLLAALGAVFLGARVGGRAGTAAVVGGITGPLVTCLPSAFAALAFADWCC
tara:strand:- start:1876 stop:2199 length:324 start_codon:yes stop_codon:yes gene_type:complete